VQPAVPEPRFIAARDATPQAAVAGGAEPASGRRGTR